MHHEDIIRAWKDQAYYDGLPEEARAQVPVHPGMRELADDELEAATGGDPIVISAITVSIAVSILVSELICDDGQE